ncbi:hypothetical protein AXA44_36755 [Rhodococcus sp. SC4]|nr:hypothetical protein AXA44_36755 [Rhodococcus sp. SC4]
MTVTKIRTATVDDQRQDIDMEAQVPNEKDDGTTFEETTQRDKGQRRRGTLILACLSIVLVAVTALGTVLFMKARAAHEVDTARSEAVAAAQDLVPKVLSYSYDNLDASLTGATEALTGQFKTDFQQLVDSTVRPTANEQKIVTNTVVQAASVVDAAEDQATVLAFINQSTTATDQQTPKVDGARLRIALAKIDDRWLISAIDPV